MGFILAFVKSILKTVIYFSIFFAFIVLIPNLPPYTKFTSIDIDPPQPQTGPLAPNGALNNVKKMFEGKLLGPEAFQIFDNEVYTVLATGEIVKISAAGQIVFVSKIGLPCKGLYEEHICGRPLGFEIDEKSKMLYVADAYYGIWKIDLKTDKKQLLVSPQVKIDGRQPKIFNDLALDRNGNIYWSDSSSDFYLKDGAMCMFADPMGRLLAYNPGSNTSKVLLDKLWLANGVAVSPENDFVLVAESNKYRILKYFIDGPHKGKSEVFVTGLPGLPDNLRVLPDGSGVLVALYTAFDDENPLLARNLAKTPLLRKFLNRLQRVIEIPFEFINQYLPHVVFEEIVYYIGHFKSISGLAPQKSGLVIIDWKGNIIDSFYNTDQSVKHISDAIVYNDMLYLGNPHLQDFIGAVSVPPSLKKVFTKSKAEIKKLVGKETQKRTTETPTTEKPITTTTTTTTTEKPTTTTTKKPTTTTTTTQKPTTTTTTTTQKPTTTTTTEKPTTTTTTKKSTTTTTTTEKPTATTTTKKPTTASTTTQKPTTTTEKPSTSTTTTNKPPTIKPDTETPKEKQRTSQEKADDYKTEKADEIEPQKTDRKTSSKSAKIKSTGQEIPIEEQIPSDTAKPNNEKFKVIKKEGPTEIPNPNL